MRRIFTIAAIVIILLFLAGCGDKPPVASPSDVAAAARPADLPDISDQYGCPENPARIARPTSGAGAARVKESQVAKYISELEARGSKSDSVRDECARRNSVLSTTYEAARKASKAGPPQE